MTLANTDTIKIAKLARLQMEDSQVSQYTETLASILNLIDNMQQADTQAVEPLSNPLDATQRLRADEVTETNQRDAYLANAPLSEEGLFLVPKVIE